MPKCSVIGCGATKTPSQTDITLHRLPKNEIKKRKWLDAIGTENINRYVKDIFICSLHFEEDSFNKTLDVIRLRDDALPSQLLLPPTCRGDLDILTENRSISMQLTRESTSSSPHGEEDHAICIESKQEPPLINHNSYSTHQRINRLKEICIRQRNHIKRLNEKLHRRQNKLVKFRNIIKDLKERPSSITIVVLEE